MNILATCVFLTLFVCVVHGFDWGPESGACDEMMPKLDKDAKAMDDDSYYRIAANKETYYPGEKLYIRIKGKTSEDRYTYQGALLTVKAEKSVGMWGEFHASKYRRIACDGAMDTGIVESNEMDKIVGDDVFVWTAPDKCEDDSPFVVLTGTVMKNNMEYSPAVSALLECVEKPSMPPMPDVSDACMENYHMSPNNGTSFEMNYGGWWNDPMSALRWSRHTGDTESPLTGPLGAITGKWYIYSEASYPAKENDMAILNSPIGLAGCMCVRLKCHMYGGPGLKFEFLVNGKLGFDHSKPIDNWINAYETVNVPGDVQASYTVRTEPYNIKVSYCESIDMALGYMIQLVMIRGKDFRGDIAIDDISILPGMCEEDRMRG